MEDDNVKREILKELPNAVILRMARRMLKQYGAFVQYELFDEVEKYIHRELTSHEKERIVRLLIHANFDYTSTHRIKKPSIYVFRSKEKIREDLIGGVHEAEYHY